MTGKKSGLLLDASGLPASPRGVVVRNLKTYSVADLEVSTDALGPLELITHDPFSATIVAVAIELEKRDQRIAELTMRVNESHARIDLLASDLRRAHSQILHNRLGVEVAQRATEALMVEAGALK